MTLPYADQEQARARRAAHIVSERMSTIATKLARKWTVDTMRMAVTSSGIRIDRFKRMLVTRVLLSGIYQ